MNDGILRPRKQRRIWSPRTILLLAILVGATVLTAACSAGLNPRPWPPRRRAAPTRPAAPPPAARTPASSVPANARRAAQLVNQWTACICPGIRCQRGSRTRLLQEVRCTWRGPLLYLVDLRWTPGGLPRVLAAPGRRAGLGAWASAFVRERGSGSYQGPYGGPGPRRARRLPVPRARTGELPGEHAVARATARQAPGRRGKPTEDGFVGHGLAGCRDWIYLTILRLVGHMAVCDDPVARPGLGLVS